MSRANGGDRSGIQKGTYRYIVCEFKQITFPIFKKKPIYIT